MPGFYNAVVPCLWRPYRRQYQEQLAWIETQTGSRWIIDDLTSHAPYIKGHMSAKQKDMSSCQGISFIASFVWKSKNITILVMVSNIKEQYLMAETNIFLTFNIMHTILPKVGYNIRFKWCCQVHIKHTHSRHTCHQGMPLMHFI